MKIIKVLLGLAIIICIFGFAAVVFYLKIISQRQEVPLGADKIVTFTIKPDESLNSVSSRLASQRLISSDFIFRLYLRINGLGSSIQAGAFKLSRDASIKEIAGILQNGRYDLKITIPEGWRREEVAEYINSKFNPPAGGQNSKFDIDEFLKETEGSEGYLFPDTYFVPPWFTAKRLIEVMRGNFDKKYATLPKSTLPQNEVITLASIVEREAKLLEDRPIVAGILLKRLEKDWPLEVDAPLQYAIANLKFNPPAGGQKSKLEDVDWWPKDITTEDLKLDSPYNTRKYKGLPPTPICSPGLSAIEAVVRSTTTDYWFYLSDKEGKMHYAKTLEEHNTNVRLYLAE